MAKASPGEKLASEARLMRNGGRTGLGIGLTDVMRNRRLARVPHPSALRAATFPPGEGFGRAIRESPLRGGWEVWVTLKQERFIREYLVDLCGAAAARRAGYATAGARNTAYRLLKIPEIQRKVAMAMELEKEDTQLRREQVLEELKSVAFAAASDASGASSPKGGA